MIAVCVVFTFYQKTNEAEAVRRSMQIMCKLDFCDSQENKGSTPGNVRRNVWGFLAMFLSSYKAVDTRTHRVPIFNCVQLRGSDNLAFETGSLFGVLCGLRNNQTSHVSTLFKSLIFIH